MVALKHIGRVKNTGRKCIVVFREMYDEKGNVVDSENCLVLETESLPDAEHQEIIRILESNSAQNTGDVFNVFARERLGNGLPALTWMHQSGRLRKFPTDNIVLTPDSSNQIELNTLNKIVQMQKSGATEEEINNALVNDTDAAPRVMQNSINDDATQQPPEIAEAVVSDVDLAQTFIAQAETFEKQASDLRKQAIELDPSLAPKPKKPRARKPRQTKTAQPKE